MQDRRLRARLVTSALALVIFSGCHKTAATAPDADVAVASASADMVGAAAPADPSGDVATLTPPQAVVAADPNIPLNEAVVGTAQLPRDYSADTAPPPQAVMETQPPSPDPENVWVSGYWWWSRPLARYVWISGAWRHPPPDQVWVSGSWTPQGGRYGWTPGYWGPRGYAREMIDVAPPAYRVEVRPTAPGAEFVWTPGYYAHRGGSYAWTGGTWVRPPSANVAWVEPRYVNTGGRYFLQPGRWDVPIERRGVVYQPDINVRAGARVTLAPVAREVVVEHTRFVAESSRAVAHGVVRADNGTFVVPRAVVNTGVVVHEERRDEHGGRVEEHPVVGRVEEHGGANVRVEEHPVVGRVEEHAGANVDVRARQPEVQRNDPHATVQRTEPHVDARGVAPVVTPAHTATTTARPPEQHEREHRR